MKVLSVQQTQSLLLIQETSIGSLEEQIPALLDCSQHVTSGFLVFFIYHIVTNKELTWRTMKFSFMAAPLLQPIFASLMPSRFCLKSG